MDNLDNLDNMDNMDNMDKWLKRIGVVGVITALAYPAIVLAQAPAGQPPVPSFGERLSGMLPMLVMVYFIFYFLVIRPRASEEKAQKALLDGLKKGDAVVTSFGLFGKIASIDDRSVTLEVAPGIKIRVEPKTVVKREEREAAAA